MIEVWRPGRPEGQRRSAGRSGRRESRPPPGAFRADRDRRRRPPAVAAGEPAPADARRPPRKVAPARTADRGDAPAAPPPSAARPPGAGRTRERTGRRAAATVPTARGVRTAASAGRRAAIARIAANVRTAIPIAGEIHQGPRRRRDRRDKAPDPNSPFAKLAALKAAARGEQQGADTRQRSIGWIASASTNGCGMPASCARAGGGRARRLRACAGQRPAHRCRRAGRCGPATSSPSRSTAGCGC